MNCSKCGVPLAPEARFCPRCGNALAPTEPSANYQLPSMASSFIGREIGGRYRILAKLGEGGMGAVFRAEQISLKRRVALKVLRPELSADPGLVRRFNSEAELAAKLNHPNTVTLFDFGQDTDGSLFIAMEFVEGMSLRDVMAKSGPLPPQRIVAIGAQVCASLADAHATGIVHRDLKPDNVMLSSRGGVDDVVTVVDFGIAKLRDERSDGTSIPMTQQGDLLGTPQYMAPEQIRAEPVDGRTDVYAMGAMLYEMTTGRLPFEGPTLMAILSKHLTEPPVPPVERRRDLGIPEPLSALILACMQKNAAHRPGSMQHLGARLAELRVLLSQGNASRPVAMPVPRSHSRPPGVPQNTPAEGHAPRTPAPQIERVQVPTPAGEPVSISFVPQRAATPAPHPGAYVSVPGTGVPGYPSSAPGYPSGAPGYPSGAPGYPSGAPGYPGGAPATHTPAGFGPGQQPPPHDHAYPPAAARGGKRWLGIVLAVAVVGGIGGVIAWQSQRDDDSAAAAGEDDAVTDDDVADDDVTEDDDDLNGGSQITGDFSTNPKRTIFDDDSGDSGDDSGGAPGFGKTPGGSGGVVEGVYVNPKHGYSIELPSGFTGATDPNNPSMMSASGNVRGNLAMIVALSLPIDPTVLGDAGLREAANSIASGFDGSVVTVEKKQIAGELLYSGIYDTPQGLRMQVVLYPGNGQLLAVAFSTTQSSFDATSRARQNLFESRVGVPR